MAVRSAGCASPAEPDPEWLKDLPATKAAKAPSETIPSPPANPGERSEPRAESDVRRQPPADAASAGSADTVAKPTLGEGFKIHRETAPPEKSDEVAKPALPGLELPAENSLPAPDGNAAPRPLVIPDNN